MAWAGASPDCPEQGGATATPRRRAANGALVGRPRSALRHVPRLRSGRLRAVGGASVLRVVLVAGIREGRPTVRLSRDRGPTCQAPPRLTPGRTSVLGRVRSRAFAKGGQPCAWWDFLVLPRQPRSTLSPGTALFRCLFWSRAFAKGGQPCACR